MKTLSLLLVATLFIGSTSVSFAAHTKNTKHTKHKTPKAPRTLEKAKEKATESEQTK